MKETYITAMKSDSKMHAYETKTEHVVKHQPVV